jgi:NAD(P)H-flavin reductase
MTDPTILPAGHPAPAAGAARTAAGPGPDPMRPAPFRVVRNRRETHDTRTFTLEPVAVGATFTFQAGQFNMLYAPGVGEAAISMSGSPGTVSEVVHTFRAVGRVTRTLQRLGRGDVLGLRGPFGAPWPVSLAEGRDVLVVAGGIGLAPLRSALRQILERRERFGRVSLLYGARSPQDILFAKEIETWRGRFEADIEVTVDRASAGWHGSVGVVTTLIPRAHFDPDRTAAFVCGPEIMMYFTVRELARRGVPHAQVWISMERNMRCGIGLCGHCQFGPRFVCKDGPVFRYDRVASLLGVHEL